MNALTWDQRARLSIAHGSLTNSKRPECLIRGIYPTHLQRGHGAYVWDTDGKKYVDFICGLGTNLLGYGHEEIRRAIHEHAGRGACLSLGTTIEVEAAEKVKELFPFIDRLRFLKTGSDACSAAIRIARARTDRKMVLSEGYHGFHDAFVSMTPPALGVIKTQDVFPLKDLSLITEETAAVIVEPIMTDTSNKRIEFLRRLKETCAKNGAVLIFDEIITGFRFPKLSVSACHGVEPDIICLGKAIANGMPLSVVGGKLDVMECCDYFVSSTYAGETLSLAAAMKTMTLLQTKYRIDDLWAAGGRFIRAFNAIYPEKIRIEGYPTRGAFAGDDMTKALFWQEACIAGIIFGPSFFFNFPHMEVADSVLHSCADILRRIRSSPVALLGEMPRSPISATVRGENGN